MSKPAKRPKAKAPAMTKTELRKRAQESVRKQPAAKRTRANCHEGHVKAVLGITKRKRPKFEVGDTWVNEHHQLLRITAITSRHQVLDSRFTSTEERILIVEITEGKVQLQFCTEKGFTPEQWGWERIAHPQSVKNPVTWRQLQ